MPDVPKTITVAVSRFGRRVTAEVSGKPIYSGIERAGMCACAHRWDAHHLQLVLESAYHETTGEEFIPAECTECECRQYAEPQSKGVHR